MEKRGQDQAVGGGDAAENVTLHSETLRGDSRTATLLLVSRLVDQGVQFAVAPNIDRATDPARRDGWIVSWHDHPRPVAAPPEKTA